MAYCLAFIQVKFQSNFPFFSIGKQKEFKFRPAMIYSFQRRYAIQINQKVHNNIVDWTKRTHYSSPYISPIYHNVM